MSFQEKNITVSLVNFALILGFYLLRLFQMSQEGSFNSENVFSLFRIVIVLAVIVTIVATILTHIGSGILTAIRTRAEPKIEDIEDERDRLIDLRGTRVTYLLSSLGSFFAMLTLVLDQPPLLMFTLLILFGLVAQVAGDLSRLYLYRKGF